MDSIVAQEQEEEVGLKIIKINLKIYIHERS